VKNTIRKILKEEFKKVYMTEENYSVLATEDQEWVLLRKSSGTKPTPIPTLLRVSNLDVNSLSPCYLINDSMLKNNWSNFKKASKVFLKETVSGPSNTVDNTFTLKVFKFRDGMVLDEPINTDEFFQ
jgi:hypothetical protein